MTDVPRAAGEELPGDPVAERALELPVELESVDRVQDALAELWEQDPTVAVVDRLRLETAVVEVVGNVVEHAYAAGSHDGRVLEVHLQLSTEVVGAVISDNGMPVELDLGSVTMPDEDAESGRGLALTLAAVDDLRYVRLGGRNRWTMVCRRADG